MSSSPRSIAGTGGGTGRSGGTAEGDRGGLGASWTMTGGAGADAGSSPSNNRRNSSSQLAALGRGLGLSAGRSGVDGDCPGQDSPSGSCFFLSQELMIAMTTKIAIVINVSM